jgi:hypothetical protein
VWQLGSHCCKGVSGPERWPGPEWRQHPLWSGRVTLIVGMGLGSGDSSWFESCFGGGNMHLVLCLPIAKILRRGEDLFLFFLHLLGSW